MFNTVIVSVVVPDNCIVSDEKVLNNALSLTFTESAPPTTSGVFEVTVNGRLFCTPVAVPSTVTANVHSPLAAILHPDTTTAVAVVDDVLQLLQPVPACATVKGVMVKPDGITSVNATPFTAFPVGALTVIVIVVVPVTAISSTKNSFVTVGGSSVVTTRVSWFDITEATPVPLTRNGTLT
jgi:hypothetical protein